MSYHRHGRAHKASASAVPPGPHMNTGEDSLFHALLSTTNNGVLVLDQHGTIQIFNAACVHLFQYEPEEVLGRNVTLLLSPVYQDVFAEHLNTSDAVHSFTTECEAQGVRKDGSLFPMQLIIGEGLHDGKQVILAVIQDLTELHRERTAHDDERAYLELILDSTSDAIVSYMQDGTVRSWNRTTEKMFGFKAEEVVGAKALSLASLLVPPELIETEMNIMGRVLAGETVPPHETVRLHKDGTHIPVEVSAIPIRDAQGAVVGVTRTVRDLRERRSLEEKAALLSAIVSCSTDAIISCSLDGTTTSWNQAAKNLYGRSPEEMIGRNCFEFLPELMPPEDVERERRVMNLVISGEQVPPYEATRFRKDGSHVQVLVSVSPIRNASGTIVGTSRTLRDVSERRAYEQQRALLSSIVESSNDAVYTRTLDGIVTSWNAAATALFGYHAGEIMGRSIMLLIPPEQQEQEYRALERVRTGTSIRYSETVRMRKDGKRIDVAVTVTPVRDAKGLVIGASTTIRDITERKDYEARLAAMREDMIHVGRLHELSQVSAGIAHELNQPLAAMLNYSNVARRLVAQNEPAAFAKLSEVAERLGEQAARASQIVRRMRDFVEKRAPHRAVEDIGAITEDAIALALIGAKTSRIETHVVRDPVLPPVLADRVQIQQVLVNLLRNAVEAMAETEKRSLKLTIKKVQESFVEITVADTGCGIPPAVAAQLFSPFVTSKPDGMGIGLAISKSIIEFHGGELHAEPNPEGGSVFRFTLPIAPPEL